jgi:hypothetical protein
VSPSEASKLVAELESPPASLKSTATAGGPPPPPPPPGPAPRFEIDEKPVAPAAATGGLGAVFSELNKGEAVTKGLRKVDPKEMTHKNPSLRAGATVPTRSDSQPSVSSINRGKSPAPPGKKPKPESMRTKKPTRKELDGNKWYIVSSPCSQVLLPSLKRCYRKTTTTNHNPLKSKYPYPIQFSSAGAVKQSLLLREKPMPFQSTIRPDYQL